MGVARFYQFEDVKAAMDRSEGQYLHLFRQVWGATDYDWEKREFRNKAGEVVRTIDVYKGPKEPTSKAEPGHAYEKHIGLDRDPKYMSGPEGRSFYADPFTAIKVTQALLNGSKGQQALADLDAGTATDRKIVDAVPPLYYGGGSGDNAFSLKKIETAVCCIMKLGDSTLWIHTTYPKHFHATV